MQYTNKAFIKTALAQIWEKTCPALYRETNPEKLPDASRALLASLAKWWDDADREGQGLFLSGPSGVGKSRLCWSIIRTAAMRGARVMAFDGAAWSLTVAGTFGDPPAASKWLRDISQVDILFLDDAFKGKITEAQELAYYGVLEGRSANKLPTFWTCNATKKSLKDRFTDVGQTERFEPIMRRITDFCERHYLS